MVNDLPEGGIALTDTELDRLWGTPWHPVQVAEHLDGITAPWYIAAGWALDLFRGEQTRQHADTEIAIPAAQFPEIRNRFGDYEFDVATAGHIWQSPPPHLLERTHQTWLRDPATGRYLLDIFREPHDGDTWICRRDESIRLPYAGIIRHTPEGIPYLIPELVLLFKAKANRPKDNADFAATLPLLTRTRRDTLADLPTRTHRTHPWLALL